MRNIVPIFIGDKDPSTSEYSNYFNPGCHPILQGGGDDDVVVTSIEKKLAYYLESEGLGPPVESNLSLKSLLECIRGYQGQMIGSNVQLSDERKYSKAIDNAVRGIIEVVNEYEREL